MTPEAVTAVATTKLRVIDMLRQELFSSRDEATSVVLRRLIAHVETLSTDVGDPLDLTKLLARQNSDLQAANNRYRERAHKAEEALSREFP